MELDSNGGAAAIRWMQERHGLGSRADGRSRLVQPGSATRGTTALVVLRSRSCAATCRWFRTALLLVAHKASSRTRSAIGQ